MKPFIVGIAGGSASGKTSVANVISKKLKSDITIISLDSYYQGFEEYAFEERVKINFDHPSSFEINLLAEHIRRLRNGQSVDIPVYDFVAYERTDKVRPIEPTPIIIVEGLFVLFEKNLRELFDLKIFVDCDSDKRLIRRIRRDIIERGRKLESVLFQYENQVKPMHEMFIEPSKQYADIILPEGVGNKRGIKIILDHLKKEKKRSLTGDQL